MLEVQHNGFLIRHCVSWLCLETSCRRAAECRGGKLEVRERKGGGGP